MPGFSSPPTGGDLESNESLNELVASGALALVATGFRCFTKAGILEQLGVAQESLPFDNGFFPPESIASVLESNRIDLALPRPDLRHTACIKLANFEHREFGRGIKFETTTYEDIDRLAISPDQPDINRYLDATLGYYTLDTEHHYVLAHYNWHRFADIETSGGVYDIQTNISVTSALLKKRLLRLHQKCQNAKWVIFVFGEVEGYRYMMIDDLRFDLSGLKLIPETANRIFGNKCQIVNLSDISSARDVLDMIR